MGGGGGVRNHGKQTGVTPSGSVCLSLTLMRTRPIKMVTTVNSRAVMSITMAEPTLVLKNITVAIQPLQGGGGSDGGGVLAKHKRIIGYSLKNESFH